MESPFSTGVTSRSRAPDDLVFNYANGAIRAISRVISPAVQRVQPDGLEEGGWEREGYLLSVEYRELEKPLALNDIPVSLRAGGPGPFTVVGGVSKATSSLSLRRLALNSSSEPAECLSLASRTPCSSPLEDSMTDAQAIYDKLCTPECDVRFPEWIVSDYLLSLSAKPFVLLSGISGTGKTQIALKVAELLAGEDEVLEAGRVKQSETTRTLSITQSASPPSRMASWFPVRRTTCSWMSSLALQPKWSCGPTRVSLMPIWGGSRSQDRQPVMRLMWRKPSLEWIQATAQLGDVLEMKQAADDPLVIDVRVLKPHRSTSVGECAAHRARSCTSGLDGQPGDLLGFGADVLPREVRAHRPASRSAPSSGRARELHFRHPR